MIALRIICFAVLLVIVAPLAGFGVWKIVGDDSERAAQLLFTGFAFLGAVLGAMGATTPKDPERVVPWRDWVSKVGWSFVSVGAGGAFVYQLWLVS